MHPKYLQESLLAWIFLGNCDKHKELGWQFSQVPANHFFLSRHHPTLKCLEKIDEGQQKIKIVGTNQQSNLGGSCQSIFSLCRHPRQTQKMV